MDYCYSPAYDDLLTRRCRCGGAGEMLIDNVTDFVVRCSSCHRSTHAYTEPELAAAHWNSGDDLMPQPLQIFWDDSAAALQGADAQRHIIHLAAQRAVGFCHHCIHRPDPAAHHPRV